MRRSNMHRTSRADQWRRSGKTTALILAGLLTASPLAPAAMAQTATTPSEQAAPVNAGPASAPVPAPQSTAPQAAEQPAPVNAGPASAPAPAPPSTAPQATEPTIGGALLPRDLSPMGMFLHADVVVKAVLIGLVFASFITWTAFVAKSFELRGARRRVRRALRILAGVTTLGQAAEQLHKGTDAAAQLVGAAVAEIRLSANMPADGLKERIVLQLERIELANSRKISLGTGVLATIGSTAPFVGLFGTVWGIMDSFIGISNAHTTNLAVVAPGIAEALLATAFGLVAAIPAVVIYNALTRATAHYRLLLGDVSAQVMRLVSRDLDRVKLKLGLAAE
jgi:biopolymer transport protein ExbB